MAYRKLNVTGKLKSVIMGQSQAAPYWYMVHNKIYFVKTEKRIGALKNRKIKKYKMSES